MLALVALLGCGEPEQAPAPAPVAAGWIAEVALEPARFAALAHDGARAGWVALHAHDYAAAVEALDAPSHRARAAWQLAVLHDDLARLSREVHAAYFPEWARRVAPPAHSAGHAVARLAADCSLLHEGGLEGPWAARAALHAAALDGDPSALSAPGPVVVEPAEGFERRFYDPCVHDTLAAAWTRRVGDDLAVEDWRGAVAWAGDDVAGRLFAPWLTPESLRADLARVDRPGLVGVGSPLELPELDGPDAVEPARAFVQALDARLARVSGALSTQADAQGAALLADLALVARYRQELLVVRAREALLDDRPRQALTLLQLARDPTVELGPRNAPALYALLAEAELRTGRVREALDALQVLAGAHPEVRALQEVTGDLAVLRGLSRQGDSREQ